MLILLNWKFEPVSLCLKLTSTYRIKWVLLEGSYWEVNAKRVYLPLYSTALRTFLHFSSCWEAVLAYLILNEDPSYNWDALIGPVKWDSIALTAVQRVVSLKLQVFSVSVTFFSLFWFFAKNSTFRRHHDSCAQQTNEKWKTLINKFMYWLLNTTIINHVTSHERMLMKKELFVILFPHVP